MNTHSALSLLAVLPALLLPSALAERVSILIDTDLGTGIEDAFALGLAFGSEEVEVQGVTSVGAPARERAMMLCRFLTMTGRRHTRVAIGADPQPARPITGQQKYHHHPDPLFDRTSKPVNEPAADFLHQRLRAQPGEVTVVALGPLTNVARLLEAHAEAAPLIREVAVLEANLGLDLAAARRVLAAGVPLLVVSSEACRGLILNEAGVKRAFSPGTPLTRQVETMFQMWDRQDASLGEAFALALCFEEKFATIENRTVTIDDAGGLRPGDGTPNVRLVTAAKAGEFVNWFVQRMEALVSPARRPVAPVARGGMPQRVHVAEDYETDIERRWWMSGKPESQILPPGTGSRRACRGVLTHDFDDLLMVSRKMYSAVVFNPVPGPPMAGNTRLGFRYWLKGTDQIRVQIYSLSRGYHRQLVLGGLPRESWQEATVDMTQARRPDGTGGPLARDERIDDIQFYIDPDGELIIDDIVLYEPAADGETRPFPKRVIFSGWFDTGQQGKEWPGEFEIVSDDGAFWKAARSVSNAGSGEPWIRVGLRGQRNLGPQVQLSFRYMLTGDDELVVKLVNATTGAMVTAELPPPSEGEWSAATATFATREFPSADEIRFLVSKGAELRVDDLLLFESATERP